MHRLVAHIGSFAQNSFQIVSISYLFFNTKTNKGETSLYLESNEKKMLGGATSYKSQK